MVAAAKRVGAWVLADEVHTVPCCRGGCWGSILHSEFALAVPLTHDSTFLLPPWSFKTAAALPNAAVWPPACGFARSNLLLQRLWTASSGLLPRTELSSARMYGGAMPAPPGLLAHRPTFG